MSVEEISRVCAKLLYLMKLCVLEEVKARDRMKAYAIRNIFARLFCNRAITFSDYSHVVKYFSRAINLPADLDDDSDDETDSTDVYDSKKCYWHCQRFGV